MRRRAYDAAVAVVMYATLGAAVIKMYDTLKMTVEWFERDKKTTADWLEREASLADEPDASPRGEDDGSPVAAAL